ncbi:MAG: hypothetical protein VX938_01280, partial [Myxococcota bacterium]|nr:hypothetical protein [Myxococcota bacterium]
MDPQVEDLAGSPTGSRGMDPRSTLVLGALLLVALSAAGLRCPMASSSSSSADLSIPSWQASEPEVATLTELLEERLKGAQGLSEADSRDLLRAYEAYNLLEAEHGDTSRNPEIQDAWADYEQWALSSLSVLG